MEWQNEIEKVAERLLCAIFGRIFVLPGSRSYRLNKIQSCFRYDEEVQKLNDPKQIMIKRSLTYTL